MKLTKTEYGLIFAVTIIAFLIIYFLIFKGKVEKYGGPVKFIRRLPQADCETQCNKWAQWCKYTRPDSWDNCERTRKACQLNCYYSDYQRM